MLNNDRRTGDLMRSTKKNIKPNNTKSRCETYCKQCRNHSEYCSCLSPEIDGVELWFTASDFSPSNKLMVSGGVVTLLYTQDVWPGYGPAKIIKSTCQSLFDKDGIYYAKIISMSKHSCCKARRFPRTNHQMAKNRGMMDYEAVVNAIAAFFEGDYFCIGQIVTFDHVKGDKQDPFDMFDSVFVDQGGGGITGDDYHGTAYFHIGGGKFASAQY